MRVCDFRPDAQGAGGAGEGQHCTWGNAIAGIKGSSGAAFPELSPKKGPATTWGRGWRLEGKGRVGLGA